jgi:hypothetical protein
MGRHSYNIHERFLRHIWSKQYLKRSLRTADGKTLSVIDAGQLNSGGGPDFCNAKIKLNGITYSGDVEIHQNLFAWFQHQHQEDPRYNQVVLHVVLEAPEKTMPTLAQSGRQIPVLIMEHFLSESIHSIWRKAILDERAKQGETIRCSRLNDAVAVDVLKTWLDKLATERLELKLRRYEERLKELAYKGRLSLHDRFRPYGWIPREGEHDEIPSAVPELSAKDFAQKDHWEQVLYEGILECLGYDKNRDPFVRLARCASLKQIRELGLDGGGVRLEAFFTGVSGLIPKLKSVREASSRTYVRQLKSYWKILRPSYRSELLHATDWQFFPTRPSNFPTLRLAAASEIVRLICTKDLFRSLIQTMKADIDPAVKVLSLTHLFSIETSDFWKCHYHFNHSTRLPVRALGETRIREIVINVILPLGLLYARIFKDKPVRAGAAAVYRIFPSPGSNSIIRLMEKNLVKKRFHSNAASYQQALVQLYKFYCSDNRCSDCALGFLLSSATL